MRAWIKILEETGWPRVYLVTPEQFERIEGDKIKGADGIASETYPVITIRRGLTGKALKNTLYHELAHILFPHRQHWWVEAFAEKMARGGGKGEFCTQYGHSPDELPPRKKLIESARRASKRLNAKRRKM